MTLSSPVPKSEGPGPPADSITASIAAGANYLAATSSAITQSVNRAVDSGTVTLTVSNSSGTAVYTASTSYGQGSTPESVAEALTGANTYVNVTAINDTLNIEAVGAGGGSTDSYTYAVSAQSTQGFSQPSFQGSPLSGNLQGGENSSSQQQVIYSFCIPGPSTPNCTSGNGYDPAGNVVSYSETTMTTKGSTSDQWSFTYDSLNRLDTATTTQAGNSYPNDCWSYDSFGNRLNQTSSSGVAFSSSSGGNAGCSLPSGASLGQNVWAQYNGTTNGIGNNQISATSQNPNQGQPGGYDQAGDVLNDGLNQYLYDGEGRICASLSVPMPGMSVMTGYVYDADGNRVAKGTITSWSCDPSSNGFTTAGNETDYVVGPGGAQVTELAQDANGSMNWQRTYVYGGGALIATYDPVPNPQFNQAQYNSSNPTVDPPTLPLPSFRLTDWLGTMRATTDAYGVWQGGCTGLPFGDGVACNGNIPDPHHFTGKERDQESGNDYFSARYYASSMGRFMSPDWSANEEPVPYAKLDDPQSLNLYAYMMNNPLGGVDADGHCGENVAFQAAAGNAALAASASCSSGATQSQLEKGMDLGSGAQVGARRQIGQDPTLPTAEAPPLLSNEDIAGLKTGTEFAALVGVPEIGEAGGIKLLSSIGEDTKLVKYAEDAGKSVQKGLDHLVEELGKGNTNPGLGTKGLGDGISYARARDGARVFFKQAQDTITILAKASKANESQVINYLKSLF